MREREVVRVKREPEEVRVANVNGGVNGGAASEETMERGENMDDGERSMSSLPTLSASQGSQGSQSSPSQPQNNSREQEDEGTQGADVEMPLGSSSFFLLPSYYFVRLFVVVSKSRLDIDADTDAGYAGARGRPDARCVIGLVKYEYDVDAFDAGASESHVVWHGPSAPSYPRALSPEDWAPSPFAPPVLPPPAAELSPLSALAVDGVDTGIAGVQDALVLPLPLAVDTAGLGMGIGMAMGLGGMGVGVGMGMGMSIAPGPPVSPDWPLPHAPFPLSSVSASAAPPTIQTAPGGGGYAPPPTSGTFYLAHPSALGYASAPAAASAFSSHASTSTSSIGAPAPGFTSPAERQMRAVEWGALLGQRRRAGERAMADAREAEARRRGGRRSMGCRRGRGRRCVGLWMRA
ncbi:hypothetical protein C8F04DRAFT_1269478 [Mycena alexandri]|uniref:Uncharacterized protein n=1 Tax=Mycena alexandri TaxID=1745969 RepID=A0AAD6WXY8_9AGAR|nr:hypothetical protein C8F04DRAFT_1269478 [Mycena alexandri]